MVYNQGVPASYQPMPPQNTYQVQPYQGATQPQMTQVQPMPQMSNLQSFQQSPKKINVVWAQGEDAARAYPIEPNSMLIIFDTNMKSYYTKSSDITGYPSPMEIYDYHKREQSDVVYDQPTPSYDMSENMATKEDMQMVYDEITSVKQMLENRNNRQNKQQGGVSDGNKQHG